MKFSCLEKFESLEAELKSIRNGQFQYLPFRPVLAFTDRDLDALSMACGPSLLAMVSLLYCSIRSHFSTSYHRNDKLTGFTDTSSAKLIEIDIQL